jgi:hypothetical protein
MLAIIALVLLFPTFFIWAGIPIFIVGRAVGGLTASPIVFYLSISLSGGILFSLYFLPINLKVARRIVATKGCGTLNTFLRIEAGWVAVVAIIFVIIIRIIDQ